MESKFESQTYYDYSNVLIKPRKSTLTSRSEVDLHKTISFPNSSQTWTGVPIIAANMDTTGTFELYNVLKEHKMITAFTKHYNDTDYIKYDIEKLDKNYFMVSKFCNIKITGRGFF